MAKTINTSESKGETTLVQEAHKPFAPSGTGKTQKIDGASWKSDRQQNAEKVIGQAVKK